MFTAARGVTTVPVPAANTIEVFIDDKPVEVDPACTVLQVTSLVYLQSFRCSISTL